MMLCYLRSAAIGVRGHRPRVISCVHINIINHEDAVKAAVTENNSKTAFWLRSDSWLQL